MKKNRKRSWKRGEKTIMSQKTGMLQSYISDIFNRRTTCGKAPAVRILKAADEMGLSLKLEDLIFNESTTNPLFTPLQSADNGKTENTAGNSPKT